jgi:hypothetical protein
MIKKIIVLFFILFSPIISYAAATDCTQLANDGKTLCVPATYYFGSPNQRYATVDEAIDAGIKAMCQSVSLVSTGCQNKTSPEIPQPCDSGNSCSLYTHVSSPIAVQLAIYALQNSNQQYLVQGGGVQMYDICPYNTTGFLYGTDSAGLGLYMCKYPYSPSATTIITKNTGCPICQEKNAQLKGNMVNVGDPINLGGGNHYEVDTDISYSSTSPISFTRYYNSQLQQWTNNLQIHLAETNTATGDFISLTRENGDIYIFKNDGSGNWLPTTSDIIGQLLTTSTGFSFQNSVNDIENYDTTGKLINIIKLGGQIINFNYNNNGFLSSVSDQYNNTLNITITNPASCSGSVITNLNFISNGSSIANNYSYTYGSGTSCQITQVNFPDNSYKQYIYTSNFMSSLIDENQNTYANWSTITNTSLGYVTSSNSMGSALNINKYTFTYTSNSTTITDSLGNSNTLNNTIINGINYTKGSSTICVDCKGLQANTTNYDALGNLTSSTDFNGNITNYNYNTNQQSK